VCLLFFNYSKNRWNTVPSLNVCLPEACGLIPRNLYKSQLFHLFLNQRQEVFNCSERIGIFKVSDVITK
jgi:hypothetical protein